MSIFWLVQQIVTAAELLMFRPVQYCREFEILSQCDTVQIDYYMSTFSEMQRHKFT